MGNLANHPDGANALTLSMAQAVSGRHGANNVRGMFEKLQDSTEDREAFFKTWNKSLSTTEGMQAHNLFNDNTRSNFLVRNQMVDTMTALNTTEDGRKVFADHMEALSGDSKANQAFFEQLNKMSLDQRSALHLDKFVKNVIKSPESKEAFADGLNDVISEKKGKLLLAGLLKQPDVQRMAKQDKTYSDDAGRRESEIRADSVRPGTGNTVAASGSNETFANHIPNKPLVYLLSQQSGQAQTKMRETRVLGEYDNAVTDTQSMIRIHNIAQAQGSSGGGNYSVRQSAYAGRIFDDGGIQAQSDRRLVGLATSSQKEKIDRIYIDLGRRYPPQDIRDLYDDAKVRYQRYCGDCGNQESGNKKATCDPCETDFNRLEVMKSAITYKFRDGYLETNPDVISISPEAARAFEVRDGNQVLDIETLRVMPTARDMMRLYRKSA
jgi:hypothetical protein